MGAQEWRFDAVVSVRRTALQPRRRVGAETASETKPQACARQDGALHPPGAPQPAALCNAVHTITPDLVYGALPPDAVQLTCK